MLISRLEILKAKYTDVEKFTKSLKRVTNMGKSLH